MFVSERSGDPAERSEGNVDDPDERSEVGERSESGGLEGGTVGMGVNQMAAKPTQSALNPGGAFDQLARR
jgi:hypothetical protein